MMRYRTIVCDPPWPHDRTGFNFNTPNLGVSDPRKKRVPYPTLSVEAITRLPVANLAHNSAHLYLWTTQKFLIDAHEIVTQWGLRPVKVLVWCKPPSGFAMGPAFGNACEFIVFARRGKPETKTRIPRDWWEWSRSGEHSAKPDAFLDLVEQVSPGPYLELFARRQRLGWDTWGNEALNHVEMPA